MNSPITGKPMFAQYEKRRMSFRKEEFDIHFHYWLCADTSEKFEDERFAELNISQLYNQYRSKHNIPTTEEIRHIRESYGVSASKMSDILGFGTNQYRQYETGEIPSISNGRLIMQAADPEDFIKMVKSAQSEIGDTYSQELIQSILSKIANKPNDEILDYSEPTSHLTGYRRPSLQRLWNMVIFFSERIQPYKVKLNKLLFYADFYHFKKYGSSISGSKYRAIPYGVVPQNYQEDFSKGIFYGILEPMTVPMFDYNAERLVGKIPFQKDIFQNSEVETMQQVAEAFADKNNEQMILLNHEEKAWIECEKERSLVTYMYAFDLKNM
jgi:putative zinc finger/helix-turn-helix YgiT family protein